MFDLHTHTFWSDGVLAPAELARRCQAAGYRGVVIADHCDHSTIEPMLEAIRRFCDAVNGHYGPLELLAGCEITHVPPELISDLAGRSRELGAAVVVAHGETIAEPVAPGTNRAAIEAGVDVLAHPGLLTEEDAALAAEKGVLLEISGRQGHCLTNGRVARVAMQTGAKLSFGSDGHSPGDYPAREHAEKILAGAGLTGEQVAEVFQNNARFFALAR